MCCAPIPRCPSPALAGRRLHPLPWALPIPVRVHGRYSRAEIEAAFVILNKSEALFSPSTRDRDRARRGRLERPIPAGWMQGMGLAV